MAAPSTSVTNAVVARLGGSRSSLLGVIASLALIIGFFLPWTSMSPGVERSLGFDRGAIARSAKRSGDADKIGLADRLKSGDAISGHEWSAVLDAIEDEGGFEGAQQRTIVVAHAGVLVLPYAAGLLALLLLLRSVSPSQALRFGLAPVSGVLLLVQSRLLSGLLMICTMAIALVVLAVTGLLWVGAKYLGEEESNTGIGIALMAGGGGFAFVSGFLGYGPGRLRGVIWSILLIAALIIAGLVIANAK